MAVVQMFPQVLRPAQRIVSAPLAIPATAFRKWQIMSDIAPADLADSTLWVFMGIDVEVVPASGVYVSNAGGAILFRCGPYDPGKGGAIVPAGQNRGFQVNAADFSGKNVKGWLECRTVPDGTDAQTGTPGGANYWETFPFRATTIGITREAVD